MESIRLLESEDGYITEYLMVVQTAVSEWGQLRAHIQGLWRDVAYEGLNSAVAGAISNMVIAMVKRTSNAVFADFLAVTRTKLS